MRSLRKRVSAVTTPEAAVITGVILISAMLLIFAGLYYHDKNVLIGAAFEAAQVGKERIRSEDQNLARECFSDRSNGKLLLFAGASCSVRQSEEELVVEAFASKWNMGIRTDAGASLITPEKKLRKQ